jgi:NhaA family Na+:H+ antiporter
MASPVTWGALLGLLVGKPVGVLLASWLALRSGLASLPEGATMRSVVGVAILCGIGFTMSLFVTNLAFPGQEAQLTAAKVGILGASLVCGLVGGGIIWWVRASSHRSSVG